jgi:hypothetical protein
MEKNKNDGLIFKHSGLRSSGDETSRSTGGEFRA